MDRELRELHRGAREERNRQPASTPFADRPRRARGRVTSRSVAIPVTSAPFDSVARYPGFAGLSASRPVQQEDTPMAALIQPMTDDEDVIREIETVPLRRDTRSVVVRVTDAIRAAGLEQGGSFRFDPHAVEELGMLPAIGSTSAADGRSEPLTRSIQHKGDGTSLSLAIPRPALEALEIDPDPDEIDWGDPPKLTVYAGDQLLAFERPTQRTLSIDRDDDSD